MTDMKTVICRTCGDEHEVPRSQSVVNCESCGETTRV